ncbi:MAG: stage II sporulation protein M [Planctomycetota bacterium]|jgi:uncharacterized membrane protein SpoIIM required for sporulation|nr:stage II sporulation protein M [Planctomycetota bacterium]
MHSPDEPPQQSPPAEPGHGSTTGALSAMGLAIDPSVAPPDEGTGFGTTGIPYPVSRIRRAVDGRWSLPESCFDTGIPVSLRSPKRHLAVWFVLGLLASLAGQLAAYYIFRSADAGAGAMLFTLVALSGYIFPAFQRNAKEVWSGELSPGRANRALAMQLGCIALSVLVGFTLLPLIWGNADYAASFHGAERAEQVSNTSLTRLLFAGTGELLLHNIRVVAVFLLVGIAFRYLGVLFVIIYNAANWGWVFAAVIAGDADRLDSGLKAMAYLGLAVSPHVVLEFAGYVCAAIAGVFISRGLTNYRPASRSFITIAKASMTLMLAAALIVALAALIEASYARWVVDHLFSNPGLPPVM